MLFFLPLFCKKKWFLNANTIFDVNSDSTRPPRNRLAEKDLERALKNASDSTSFIEIFQCIRDNRSIASISKNAIGCSATAGKKNLALPICNGVDCLHCFEKDYRGEDQFWCYSCKEYYCWKCITGWKSISDVNDNIKYLMVTESDNYNFCFWCRSTGKCTQ